MKSSQRMNVKVAVLQKDEAVQRLRDLVLVAFAVVATLLVVELQVAATLGLAF